MGNQFLLKGGKLKRSIISLVFVLLIGLIFASTAQAFVWTHVGGDPLVPGGVWSQERFGSLLQDNSKVRTALSLVRQENGQPSWVLPKAYDAAMSGKTYTGGVAKGTNLGAMSYGSPLRVVPNCLYMGQYDPLPIFYVKASKTSTVKINGHYYKKTVSYRVSMAKPCGNVFIYHRSVTKKRLYDLRVEKRLDTTTGERLGGWTIQGMAGGKDYERLTKSTGSVLVGRFLAGAKYNFSEVNQEGYEVIIGQLSGKMPRHNVTLKFVNKEICPPPPPPCYDFGTKGYWHNQNGLSELTEDDISYVNSLAPYLEDPFDGVTSEGGPVPAVHGEWGEDLAPEGSWQAEVSAYLVAPNAGGDPTVQLGQQLLAFIFNVRHRLGSLDATLDLPDGTTMTAGEIIEASIIAWESGGEEANSWASILDDFNNMD